MKYQFYFLSYADDILADCVFVQKNILTFTFLSKFI